MSNPTQTPLRQMRLAAGLSLRDLEIRTGINRGRLSLLERGLMASSTSNESERIAAVLVAALREKESKS